jgi:hypothetical protein
MKWSIGRSQYGQVIEIMDTPYSEFADFMYDAAQVPRSPKTKWDNWWISSMILKSGATTRTIDDVSHLSNFIAMDIDTGNLTLTDIKYRTFGAPLIAYTTSSAQPDDLKWRVIVGLNREMTVDEYPRVWRWFAQKFPLDSATKNINRISFIPAAWISGVNLFHHENGRVINVDSVLAMVPPEPAIPQAPVSHTPTLRPAPACEDVITAHMLATAVAAPEGKRLWRLMTSAATRYRLQGWDLSPNTLAQAAMNASALFSPGKSRPNLVREASRAIEWAASVCQPQTPLERMRNRIMLEQHRFGNRR